MLNLVLPIASTLVSLPAQDLSDPIAELIPEDAIAAIRIESIDDFHQAFTALDEVLSPGDPSSPDDALRFFLELEPELLRADLPVVMTVSASARGAARGFVVPVDDPEAFTTEIRKVIGQDAAVERIGSYIGYMNGGEYVPGGSRIGESWPDTTEEDPVLFARVDMVAVESTFGAMVTQSLELAEIAMGESVQPEGSPIDMSAVAEIAVDLVQSFMSSADLMDVALDIKGGTFSLGTELLVRKESGMAGLGSDEAPTYSDIPSTIMMDSAIQILAHMEHDKIEQWLEPMAEMASAIVPDFSDSAASLTGWAEHASGLGSGTAMTLDFDQGVPVMTAIYEEKEAGNGFYDYLQEFVTKGANDRGAEAETLDSLVVDGVTVTQIATTEPEDQIVKAGMMAIPDMTSSFARSGGFVLVNTALTADESRDSRLADQLALLKSPQTAANPMNTLIRALGAANPAMAMNIDVQAMVPQLIASGEIAEEDAPTFEGDATVRVFGGVAGLRWLGHVDIPLNIAKAMIELGGR